MYWLRAAYHQITSSYQPQENHGSNGNTSSGECLHGGGEEIFVLEGEFSDEYGEYPKGTYLRNPPGSSHHPKIGKDGASIFVKLNQFATDDLSQIDINTCDSQWNKGLVNGLSVMSLHEHAGAHTALVKWAPNTVFNPHSHWGGEEIFVIDGTFYDEYGEYPKGTWLRSPHLSKHSPYSKDDGALIYVKIGHLRVV
ncbi:MAG: cupin [Zetaproteobacteria bacterium]|nr:MAG: cupin [Zetaproteobacteria bacterium]